MKGINNMKVWIVHENYSSMIKLFTDYSKAYAHWVKTTPNRPKFMEKCQIYQMNVEE